MKPELRGVPKGLPFLLDARALALGNNYTFDTKFGAVDFLGFVEPLGDFDELAKRAEHVQFGDYDLLVTSLDDLIRVKQHINRPKDRDSLMHLLAIKRVREEKQQPPQP